jgi:Carboxypeptidase regulatory-like domain/TonB dependent receptor
MSKRNVVCSADSFCRKCSLLKLACAVLLVGLCILPSATKAQVLYGYLTGNVTDPSNAAVPGAQVEALNTATGVSRQATSDSDGVYRFTELQPGVYKVTVSAANFGTSVTENLRVDANNTRRVDVQLQLKAQTESVTVSAAPPELQTDRTDVNTQLSTKMIEDLPLLASNGRNFQSALRIVPGVGLLSEQNSAAGNPQRAMTANVSGGSFNNNNTRIDGAVDTYAWLPANVAYVPSVDAIESVNVVTNNFDAEQGMAGGAAIRVTTKSGTNQLHGSAYEFHTDNHLRTRNFFLPASVLPVKSKNIFNQYGGTIGGPIKKDKLFFFGSYEGTKIRTAGSTNARSVPSLAIRNGDFSAAIPAGTDCNVTPVAGCIYDPNTGNASGAGRRAFPGNIIPANRIDPAASTLVALIPKPNVGDPNSPTNNLANFLPVGAPQYNLSRIDAKVSYVPNQKSVVFARYSISPSFIFDPPALGDAGGDATGGGQNGNAFSRTQSVALGGSYQLTPSLLWDVNAGYTRLRLNAENVDIGTNFGLTTLKIPGTNGSDHAYGGIPAFQFPGTFSNLGNANTGNPFIFRDNQYVANTNLSWIRGRHDVRFGMEYYRSGINHFQPQGGTFGTARGSFQFTGSVTGFNQAGVNNASGANNPYNSLAQFLLGLPERDGKVVQNINPNALRFTTWAGYARDRWQLTPKLTVTYGVRWEFYPFGTSDHSGLKVFDPKSGKVVIGGYGSVPMNSNVDTGHGLLAPRFGIAYRVRNKTVVRAGYGISVDPNNFRALRDAYPVISNMDYQGSQIFGGATGIFSPSASLSGTNAALAPYPGLATGITLVTFNPATGFGNGIIPFPNSFGTTTVANPYRRGYVESYNLIIQSEIKGFVGEVGYVGNRGIRVPLGLNINPGPVAAGMNNGVNRLLNANPNACTAPPAGTGGCWGDLNAVTPFKSSYYDSLQSKLTRRFSGGSLIGVSYTFSKAIDYGENEGALFRPYPAYWSQNKAVAGFDRPHNVAFYGVYALPFGRTQRWAKTGVWDAIGGGWQFSWIMSRYSGAPFSVTGGSGSANALGNTLVPDLTGPIVYLGGVKTVGVNCVATDMSCRYFAPSSWTAVPSGAANVRLGTSPRNALRGPGFFDMDVSLLRNFRITERVSFQFRASAFAVTNTPNFANPNAGYSTAPANPASNYGFGVITSTVSGAQFASEAGNLSGQRTFWFAGKVIF